MFKWSWICCSFHSFFYPIISSSSVTKIWDQITWEHTKALIMEAVLNLLLCTLLQISEENSVSRMEHDNRTDATVPSAEWSCPPRLWRGRQWYRWSWLSVGLREWAGRSAWWWGCLTDSLAFYSTPSLHSHTPPPVWRTPFLHQSSTRSEYRWAPPIQINRWRISVLL